MKIYFDDGMLFQNKENKTIMDPPKKAQGYKLSRYVYMHKCLSIQSTRDLDIH